MDNVINGLLSIYNPEKNDQIQPRKGTYLDISFEYYPMEPIKDDSVTHDNSMTVAELIDDQPSSKSPKYEEVETANLRLLKEFDIDLDFENTPIEMPADNVFFKKMHNNFVDNFVDDFVQMNNDMENLVNEWKEPEEKAIDHSTFLSLGIDEQKAIEQQITFKVFKLSEQDYFEDFNEIDDLQNYESAQFRLYQSDNFANVKRCFAFNSGDRAHIMSGFFVIDGMILEPYLENSSFKSLQLDENSEIVLVTWSNENYYSSGMHSNDDEQLWDNIFD